MDLLFLDDIIAAHAMDVFSKYSLLHQVKSKNPQEAWDVFCAGWSGTFGPPKSLQMDEGGEWENEVRADYCSERRIKLFFQGVGEHPCLWERRNGLARGIYNRLIEDDRFSSGEILGEVQWCLNAMLSSSGISAYHMVFGFDPADFLDGVIATKTYYLRKIPRGLEASHAGTRSNPARSSQQQVTSSFGS